MTSKDVAKIGGGGEMFICATETPCLFVES